MTYHDIANSLKTLIQRRWPILPNLMFVRSIVSEELQRTYLHTFRQICALYIRLAGSADVACRAFISDVRVKNIGFAEVNNIGSIDLSRLIMLTKKESFHKLLPPILLKN